MSHHFYQQYKRGQMSLEDDASSKRPVSATSEENINFHRMIVDKILTMNQITNDISISMR